MKTNTMNGSHNSKYFWKIISTNECIQIKMNRKCKENMYILPPQSINFLVQCPCDTLLMCTY